MKKFSLFFLLSIVALSCSCGNKMDHKEFYSPGDSIKLQITLDLDKSDSVSLDTCTVFFAIAGRENDRDGYIGHMSSTDCKPEHLNKLNVELKVPGNAATGNYKITELVGMTSMLGGLVFRYSASEMPGGVIDKVFRVVNTSDDGQPKPSFKVTNTR